MLKLKCQNYYYGTEIFLWGLSVKVLVIIYCQLHNVRHKSAKFQPIPASNGQVLAHLIFILHIISSDNISRVIDFD